MNPCFRQRLTWTKTDTTLHKAQKLPSELLLHASNWFWTLWDWHKTMKRSPLSVGLFFLLAVALAYAQTNPASPKQGSGLPETPVPATQTGTPAPNASPANAAPANQTPANTPA